MIVFNSKSINGPTKYEVDLVHKQISAKIGNVNGATKLKAQTDIIMVDLTK